MGKEKSRREWMLARLRRRLVMGSNVVLSVLLATASVILLNALVWRMPHSWGLDVRARHQLSAKSMTMLRGLQGQVEVVVLFRPDDTLYEDVRALLMEYEHAARSIGGLGLEMEWVNPDRDIARTRQLVEQHALASGNHVIFLSGENDHVVSIQDLARYEYELTESGLSRRMIGFFGERAFSSGILAVASGKAPVVYFLAGHGERDINDFGPHSGYSSLARVISRDHFDVRILFLPHHGVVPEDCDVLVVAGPTKRLADEELRWIEDYLLQRRGRLLFLLDAKVETGLEALLARFHIQAGSGYVTGLRMPGWNLVVTEYGDHPITRSLRNVNTAFTQPRPLQALRDSVTNGRGGSLTEEDQIRVHVLAGPGPEGWVEMDFTQDPAVFDRGVDLQGPVGVAVAAERGPLSPDAKLQSTRLVVIGDSYFVVNAALESGLGGNPSFFMSALNWLAERDALLSLEPSVPYVLQPGLTRQKWRRLFGFVMYLLPGIVGAVGVFVAYRRRR
jgi:hypothetical protein